MQLLISYEAKKLIKSIEFFKRKPVWQFFFVNFYLQVVQVAKYHVGDSLKT